ncbi:hypothetical protein ACFP81_05515 [Deinococcus lacus]|uniref:Uncharacterized protein n=1 Tax=Deinococcus lacus TaxID=392561 RepID=A0ABW1YBE7_9DEIO
MTPPSYTPSSSSSSSDSGSWSTDYPASTSTSDGIVTVTNTPGSNTVTFDAAPPPTLPGASDSGGDTVSWDITEPGGSQGQGPVSGTPSPDGASTTPPVAGVTAPKLESPLALGRPSTAGGQPGAETATNTGPAGVTVNNGALGAATGTGATAGRPTTSAPLPTPQNPDVLGQYGNDAQTGASLTPLARTLSRNNLDFTGAVVGPRSTAIFHGDNGFMVTAVGEKIRNTDIVVREVTANSVTLALGKETLTLQLQKR